MFAAPVAKWRGYAVSAFAIGTTIVHLYAPVYGLWGSLRPVSVALFTILGVLLFPLRLPGGRAGWLAARAIDLALIAAAAVVGYYAGSDYNELQLHSGDLSRTDIVLGIALALTVLELTRRTLGFGMVGLAIAALCYAVFGQHMPMVIAHKGADLETLVDYIFILPEGIYGLPVGVAATYVIIFVLFGSLLDACGAGRYFIEFAKTLLGRTAGGPAKMAVVSSAFMGSISGSAVANVVTTGTFTIPLMVRSGMTPRAAAAVEACASTGGLILPPVMGAAAFVMGDMLGIGYSNVAIAAAIPGLLYYLALFVVIHYESKRDGLSGIVGEAIVPVRQLVRESWWMFLPILVLFLAIMQQMSAMRSAGTALLSLVVLVFVVQGPRRGFLAIVEAFDNCARAVVPVMMACACAGIVIGVILLTGIGLRFTSIVLSLAGDSKFLALFFTMIITLILGMGLPATASYITAVTLAVPVLKTLGVPPLASHMFVLYYAALSAITPPVALAAFAACGVARTRYSGWGGQEVRLGISGYVIPFFFCYGTPLLIIGSEPGAILQAAVTATLGVYAVGVAVAGYFHARLSLLQRLALLGGGLLLVDPHWLTDSIGLALILLTLGPSLLRRAQRRRLGAGADA